MSKQQQTRVVTTKRGDWTFLIPTLFSTALGVALGYRIDALNRKYAAVHEGGRQVMGRLAKSNEQLLRLVGEEKSSLSKKCEGLESTLTNLYAQVAAKDARINELQNSVTEKQATILSLGKQLEKSVNPEEAEAVAEAVKALYDLRSTEEIRLLAQQKEVLQSQLNEALNELATKKQEWQEIESNLRGQITALEQDAVLASEKIKHLSSVIHICEKCGAQITSPSYGGGGGSGGSGSGGDCDCG